MRSLLSMLPIVSVAAVLACGGSDSTSPNTAPTPASITVQNGVTSATESQVLPITVLVTTAGGAPVAGVSVAFAPSAGGVSATSEQSDANGLASVQWILPATPGQATLTVTSPGSSAMAILSVTVQPPTLTGSWSGTLNGGTANSQTLSAILIDNGGAITGNGTLSASGAGGIAEIITGSRVGTSLSLTFSATGFQSFSFTGTLATDGNSATGVVNGSGFANVVLALSKH